MAAGHFAGTNQPVSLRPAKQHVAIRFRDVVVRRESEPRRQFAHEPLAFDLARLGIQYRLEFQKGTQPIDLVEVDAHVPVQR